MKIRAFFAFMVAFLPSVACVALPLTGLYQTIDDKTNAPKSIVMLYQDGENLAGRIVALYDENGKISETAQNATKTASHVDGAPLVVGLDIIWNMKWDDKDARYSGGKIMDPENGKVYSSLIWQADDALNVRGKIGPLGRTQKWHTVNTDDMPTELKNIDTNNWKPTIRK